MIQEHAELFHAAFCMEPLSASAQAKLMTLQGVNVSTLWQFFLQHKAQAFALLEAGLALVPGGAAFEDLLKILEGLVPDPKPAPAPAP